MSSEKIEILEIGEKLMTESEIKLDLLRLAARIVESNPMRGKDSAIEIKEVYRQLVALFNEKL